ncbi:50S ribosomal protein L35 [Candidatus Uhrbacteria bacterium]|nr:50S ribosomal protein L35 [Candidatus Uhrbacteria bacterium]
MPKLKTHKAAAKRLQVTRKKLLKRKAGQDHFNSRESGKTRLNKRRDMVFAPTLAQTARRSMPYA